MLKMMKLKEGAIIPERKTRGSAGYDLCACIATEFILEPGDFIIIPTGLGVEIPEGYAGMIFTRSGLGVKHGVHVSNGVGVIDSDYRGEIHVGLRNLGKTAYAISPNERIAQLILMPIFTPDIEEVFSLTETERGAGGFGSTGR
ncbi:dUTP diphosphatase [Scatolibacter rhodanostii]|uniref:dUTP diphosphatase n=1 Tax=Scatolibacter rhodanostii TaxID=2014781 RepID=UPI000C087FBF|nr:dUTP diphosphatase [Scatolibacter rhodanostii]